MDTYSLNPDHMRAPKNLTRDEVKKSLTELDNKIKTLRGRVNATTADSNNTYHEHIAALERKRELIADKINDADETQQKWQDLNTNINDLHNDADNMSK
jgi:chromosome segregation ATPase